MTMRGEFLAIMKISESIRRADQEAHLEFVRTLFAQPGSLVVGVVLQVALMSVVLYDTQYVAFLGFIGAVIVSGLWRMSIAKQFAASESLGLTISADKRSIYANYWERRYILPSTISASIIGAFCFVGLEVGQTQLTVSATLCLLFAPVPTIVGRLYGSH